MERRGRSRVSGVVNVVNVILDGGESVDFRGRFVRLAAVKALYSYTGFERG